MSMNPNEFSETIYLGDRFVEGFHFDCQSRVVKIQVDCISRVRGKSWNNYTDEDIQNGILIFNKVKSLMLEPKGFDPNDWIEILNVQAISDELFQVNISMGSVNSTGLSTEIVASIECEELFLGVPGEPEQLIRT